MALAWCFEDEANARADALFDKVSVSGGVVPSLWRLEVANGLQMAVRRRRISAKARDQSLADLADLPLETDRETERRAWADTLRLAARHVLTLYDAAYLELAERRGLPLASLDQALCAAAHKAGVIVA